MKANFTSFVRTLDEARIVNKDTAVIKVLIMGGTSTNKIDVYIKDELFKKYMSDANQSAPVYMYIEGMLQVEDATETREDGETICYQQCFIAATKLNIIGGLKEAIHRGEF